MPTRQACLPTSRFAGRFPGLAALVLCLGLASCIDAPAADEVNALDVCAFANDGDLCDDHQACTYPDRCLNQRCVGTPIADGTPCTDGNTCTANDRCLAAVCVGNVVADGTACSDGEPCTDPDVCRLGVCQPGGPAICDDGDSCTIDSCSPGVGCVFSPRDCVTPIDAGRDTPPDAIVDVAGDSVSDSPGPGGDVAPDVAPDVVPDLAPDLVPPPDTGNDAPGDAPVDAGATDAGDAGDAAADTRDAAEDLVETPPDLRARGGGCACAVGRAADTPLAQAFVQVSLALSFTLLARRRRKKAR